MKISAAACILISAAVFSSCSEGEAQRAEAPEMTSLTAVEPYSFSNSAENIKINSDFTFKYSDYNYEKSDSSQTGVLVDRIVRIISYGKSDSGVIKLVVKNEGENDIKYAVLKCTAAGKKLTFKITTLPSGSVCVLDEDNNAEFNADESVYGFELSDVIYFDGELSIYPDVFYIRAMDGVISVKNISENDVDNVYIYYKNEENGVFVGNETYRVSFGSLKKGEEKELSAEHFKSYISKILFAEYGN